MLGHAVVTIIACTLSSCTSSWTKSIFRRNKITPSLFKLYSSIITTSNEPPRMNITEDYQRNAFDLTGICSGDDWQCTVPAREFGFNSGISYVSPSSHQLLLRFQTGPTRVMFLCKPDEEAYQAMIRAVKFLEEKKLQVYVEEPVYSFLKAGSISFSNIHILTPVNVAYLDLVIAFGGDGLLMHANTLFEKGVPPVMCFDFGSLGFLAPFSFSNYEAEMDRIIDGSALLTLRMRLQCTIYRNNTAIGSYRVLNEVVVDRGPSPYLSTVDLTCDQQYLTTLQGDGIIIATPTGSTAYSLAAGGSMVHPSVPAILLTPICAHTLSFRPLLLPDSCILTAEVPHDCRASGWVSFDGKFRQELFKGDKLEVKMSPYPLPTVNRLNFTADWFQGLRSAFLFNERPRQKPLSH